MAAPTRTYDEVTAEIALNNLEWLSQYQPPPVPPEVSDHAPGEAVPEPAEIIVQASTPFSSLKNLEIPIPDLGLTHSLLKSWSKSNQDTIKAAKDNQVFGGKKDINYQNAFLPFMESIAMYLRDVSLHTEAWEKYRTYKENDSEDEALKKEAIDLYTSAHSEIREVAELWGMGFIVLCDLPDARDKGRPDIAGPFCGLFYSKNPDKPFMGIAFKGTNPLKLAEWAVDFNYTVSASGSSPWLDGQQVSAGVFQGLFGDFGPPYNPPYKHILDTARKVADRLSLKYGGNALVPLHVTGHSLGGSYATMCYTQMLLDQAPLKDGKGGLMMGDSYTFGAPRVGSNEWARTQRTAVSLQPGQSWRIVNCDDLVPMVPPTTLWGKENQLDFHHVDRGVRIFSKKPPVILDSEIDEPNPKPYPITSLWALAGTILKATEHRKSSLLLSNP